MLKDIMYKSGERVMSKHNGFAWACWLWAILVNVVLGLFRPSLWGKRYFDRKSKSVRSFASVDVDETMV